MADFKTAYHLSNNFEGGYVYDNVDRGGETYKGISRVHNQFFKGWEIIDNYKEQTDDIAQLNHLLNEDDKLQKLICNLYKKLYWDTINGDTIISQKIANKLYDIAINQGTYTANRFLQLSLNLLNINKQYVNLQIDSKSGPKTLNTLDSFLKTTTNGRNFIKNENYLLKVLKWYQLKRYIDIIEKDKSQEKFFFGWLDRV